jgi:hypothetical protein
MRSIPDGEGEEEVSIIINTLTAHGLPERTQGDFSHSMAMLHGAPRIVYTDVND